MPGAYSFPTILADSRSVLSFAEFGERVQRLGKMVPPLKLAGRLLDGIRAGQIPSAGLLATAGEAPGQSFNMSIQSLLYRHTAQASIFSVLWCHRVDLNAELSHDQERELPRCSLEQSCKCCSDRSAQKLSTC